MIVHDCGYFPGASTEATTDANKSESPLVASPDSAETKDSPDMGRRPSWRNRLLQATKSFRPTGRKELSRDKLVPSPKRAERSDAGGPAGPVGLDPPVAAKRARGASGNLDTLLGGGGDEAPMVTAREIAPAGGKLPLLDTAGSAGAAGAAGVAGLALAAGAGLAAGAAEKSGTANADARGSALAADVESAFTGATGGRSGLPDLAQEHADLDDILASTTSQVSASSSFCMNTLPISLLAILNADAEVYILSSSSTAVLMLPRIGASNVNQSSCLGAVLSWSVKSVCLLGYKF
jgi:hypothetical protein